MGVFLLSIDLLETCNVWPNPLTQTAGTVKFIHGPEQDKARKGNGYMFFVSSLTLAVSWFASSESDWFL